MYMMKQNGNNIEPCGVPFDAVLKYDFMLLIMLICLYTIFLFFYKLFVIDFRALSYKLICFGLEEEFSIECQMPFANSVFVFSHLFALPLQSFDSI